MVPISCDLKKFVEGGERISKCFSSDGDFFGGLNQLFMTGAVVLTLFHLEYYMYLYIMFKNARKKN